MRSFSIMFILLGVAALVGLGILVLIIYLFTSKPKR